MNNILRLMPRPRLVLIIICLVSVMIISLTGCVVSSNPAPATENQNPAPATPPLPEPNTDIPVNTTPPEAVEPSPAVESGRVEVVYFHRTQRCHSCLYAEEQIIVTLNTHFTDELRDGAVTFASIDIQDEANAGVIEKYGAYSSQLFITTATGDTETTIEVIEFWNHIDDDEGFAQLIISRVNSGLEGIG